MEDLDGLIGRARRVLADDTLERTEYARLENFVLKNSSRLGATPQFAELKEVMDDIARKFDIPNIDSLREGFGANSCAQ